MTPLEEKKLLIELIKRLDRPGARMLEGRFFLPAIWIVLVSMFTLMFQLASRRLMSEPLLLVVAVLIGTFIGWILFYLAGIKQWPVVRRHIDRASIEKRLQELET